MNAPTNTITVADAAEILRVSERTVWRYLKSGRLTGQTVGAPGAQRTLITREDVLALAEPSSGDAGALRAERDRLAAELVALRAERDTLAGRLSTLHNALSRPLAPGILERALARALELRARARAPRALAR